MSRGHRDRRSDRDRSRERYKREPHEGRRSLDREPRGEKGSPSRRYGDTSDRRNDNGIIGEREEGECVSFFHPSRLEKSTVLMRPGRRLEASPEKQDRVLPPVESSRQITGNTKVDRSPRPVQTNGEDRAGGFKTAAIPTGPKSKIPQTRPLSSSNVLDQIPSASSRGTAQSGEDPVVVLEEEHDPEKLLEERRRKREEIMAKFKNKAATTGPAPSIGSEGVFLGNGADSVVSGGARTERAGILTGTTTGKYGLDLCPTGGLTRA